MVGDKKGAGPTLKTARDARKVGERKGAGPTLKTARDARKVGVTRIPSAERTAIPASETSTDTCTVISLKK